MPVIFGNKEKVINKVVEIETGLILPNPCQPRKLFNDDSLTELALSIRENGILQPLTVRKINNYTYEIVSGERRFRAAKLLKLEAVPCIIIEASTQQSAVLAILENIQRSDLNYFEEACAIEKLIQYYGITQENVAARLGKAQSTIANKLRILKLGGEERKLILEYGLLERQARALLKVPVERRLEVIEKIHKMKLNSSQTDEYIEKILAKPKPKKRNWYFKEIKLYINSFNKTIDTMKKAGIKCDAVKNTNEDYIEYVVKIPLK